MNKTVSIIVPVYNCEKYLNRCLDSLVNQTLEDIEIIVVNDGSYDGSANIINDYVKNYPDKVRSFQIENSGVANARNIGIINATGEYIGFVDSDDWVDRNTYDLMYHKAQMNDFDCVQANYYYAFQNKLKDGNITLKRDINSIDEKNDYLTYMYPVIWDKIYKASIIKNFRFKNKVWAEDVEFLYRILPSIENIGLVDKKLYYYYQRENSDSKTFNNRVWDYISNFNGIIAYYKTQNLYDLYYKSLEFCYVRYLYATFIKRVTYTSDKKMYKKAVNEAIKNVKQNFPHYRRNKYFYRSLKGIYLVSFNKFMAFIIYLITKKR